jgi:hypothetical protein
MATKTEKSERHDRPEDPPESDAEERGARRREEPAVVPVPVSRLNAYIFMVTQAVFGIIGIIGLVRAFDAMGTTQRADKVELITKIEANKAEITTKTDAVAKDLSEHKAQGENARLLLESRSKGLEDRIDAHQKVMDEYRIELTKLQLRSDDFNDFKKEMREGLKDLGKKIEEALSARENGPQHR